MVSRFRSAGVGTCLLLTAACVLTACSSSPPAAPPPTTGTPQASPMLAGCKLTLPTANDKGGATIVDPAAVSPPYLTADPTGALVFWAPVAGATTKNSEHTRTELNSLTPFTAGTSGKHSLTATVTVNQVPTEAEDVIIAQIHGTDDISSVPYVMLHWADGELKVVVKQDKGSAHKDYPLTSDVPLGSPFDIGIVDNGDGTMTFTANHDGDTPEATAPVPPAFSGANVRFQTGAYQQADSEGSDAAPDDGARVTVTALTQG